MAMYRGLSTFITDIRNCKSSELCGTVGVALFAILLLFVRPFLRSVWQTPAEMPCLVVVELSSCFAERENLLFINDSP
jgi:hypothetical protein